MFLYCLGDVQLPKFLMVFLYSVLFFGVYYLETDLTRGIEAFDLRSLIPVIVFLSFSVLFFFLAACTGIFTKNLNII